MHDVNLAGVDLNLLHVLATVLEERSATRAAQRLHVTPSAVSNALRRARDLFGDALVVRRQYGLEPTPRALLLLPELRVWVDGARRLLAQDPSFEPRSSTRTFRVACSDAVAATLLRSILRLLAERAPGLRLRLLTLDRLIAEDGLSRGSVDLVIGMPPVIPGDCEAELVYRDPMVCIVRANHPKVRTRLSLDDFASLPHVDLALFDTPDDTIDRALSKRGRSRDVRIALPHFSSVPLAVAETDCIATLSSRLARMFAERLPLRVFRPPIRLDPIEIRQVWHRRSDLDGAVRFLRSVVCDAAGSSGRLARAPRSATARRPSTRAHLSPRAKEMARAVNVRPPQPR